LRLTKHNFPFISPHCGVHIAQSRGTFPAIRRKRSLTYWTIATSPYPCLSEQTKSATLRRAARLYTSVTSYIQSSPNCRSHNTQTSIIQQLALIYRTTS